MISSNKRYKRDAKFMLIQIMKKLILCLSLSLKSCKVKAGGQGNQQERIHDDCHACFGKYHTGKKMFRGD